MITAKDILTKGREYLAQGEQFWTKGQYHNDEGAVCALGAVAVGCGADPFLLTGEGLGLRLVTEANGSSLEGTRALGALQACVPQVPFAHREGTWQPSIDTFNDRDETEHEDVLKLFDCAIEQIGD